MSTDPDTVRDNSGSLRNHRSSQGSSSQASLSDRGSSGSPRLPANSPNNGSLARQLSPISPFGTRSATTSSGTAPSGRPRQPSVSLHAAATLNAAEHKDAITSLSPKERKSVSLGAAGAGLSSADEITTLTTYFGFNTPNFASSAKNESAAMSPPIAPSPRDTTQPAPRQNSSITFSPGTTPSMAPPPPPQPSSPSSSQPKTPSQRRRSAIALNLMLADPTLPSPGELASSDRRASISSSGVAPAWGYAQRTGSIAGSTGSPASPVEFRTRSMSRSASMSRRGSLGASVIGNTIGNSGGEERHQRSLSRGDMHQEQEQEHERIVLRLFSRISALEAEVSRLRLSSSQRHARHRHRERTASPSVVTDTPGDSEVDMSAEEADIETDSVSPTYTHSHPASIRASAAHPSTAPGVNVSTLVDHGKDRSPSQPITIPNPGSRPFTMNRPGSSTGSGLGLGLARTPSTGGNGPRPPPPTFNPHHLSTRSGGSVGSAGSWGVPSGPLGRSSVSARRSTSSSYSPPAPGIAGATILERPGEHGQGESVASRGSGNGAAEDDTNFWTRSPTMTGSYPSQSPISMGMGARGDEGVAYWQSEAGYLTRENQLLRRRNRELERQLAQFENRGNSDADNNEAPVRRFVYIPRQGQEQEQDQGVGRSRGTSISELQLGNSPMRGMQPSSLSQVTPLEDEEEMEVD